MKHIIKQSKKVQVFSANKLRTSILASMYAVQRNKDAAESTAEQVLKEITVWIDNKHEVTANDIRVAVAKSLAKYDKDAAVVYKKHKDMW